MVARGCQVRVRIKSSEEEEESMCVCGRRKGTHSSLPP